MNTQNLITIFGTILLIIIIVFSTYAFRIKRNFKRNDILEDTINKKLKRKWLVYTIISCSSSVILIILMLVLYLV
ncbi:hypothetical protein [Spiroplasma endosymbiont of Labia minor]|uniref:hypothetical protein n=1 Tax=Spiroplasma endosymbiont of Labia minor TaxID=3066305 RepID=UPI0030D277DD